MNDYYKTDIDAEFCLIDCGILRDAKGRFLPSHKILSPRDIVTGRFISVESMVKQDDAYYSYNVRTDYGAVTPHLKKSRRVEESNIYDTYTGGYNGG